jgi:hypothetical protein
MPPFKMDDGFAQTMHFFLSFSIAAILLFYELLPSFTQTQRDGRL